MSKKKLKTNKAKSKNKSDKISSYTAKDIYVLEGLEPVRRRPGMYIGSTGSEGLHHLIWEVVDNSIDEAMVGYCNEIEVALLPDNIVRVADNGRGIPVEKHKQTKKSALETVMTTLHAGGKFGGTSYKVAGGLHGVGVSVVNALSIWLQAKVHRDGFVWVQEYQRGKPKAKVKKIAKSKNSGTVITFSPDPEIFKEIKFNWHKILDHLRQQAYLMPKLKIRILDLRNLNEKKQKELLNILQNKPEAIYLSSFNLTEYIYNFYFEGGIVAYIKYLNREEKILHNNIFYCSKSKNDVLVEIALQYTQDIQTKELSFANNIFTHDGGTHLSGLRTALTRTLNDYIRKNELLKKDEENLSGEDTREGLTVIVSVKVKEPQFEGQTKSRLGNPEVKSVVEVIFGEMFSEFLEKNPQDAKFIIEKSILSQKARLAAKAAKETVLRKGVLEGMTLPGKLADCTSNNPAESELFIVEGDSAGGSAKQGRNRYFQAILPLRGKILNVEKARLDKMLASKEIRALIIALGTAIAEEFNINKIRYHKIIIMTDADVDGAHIRTLLLTLFYRYFQPIIEAGYLFIAQPPLYRIQGGKIIKYAFSDEEKEKIIKEFGKTIGISIQRYKGLGEMNPEQLWETTMNPENRVLKIVKIEDAIEADRIFDILMGEDVLPRKKFIQTHAKKVKNLDI